jgi:hypothetical protein
MVSGSTLGQTLLYGSKKRLQNSRLYVQNIHRHPTLTALLRSFTRVYLRTRNSLASPALTSRHDKRVAAKEVHGRWGQIKGMADSK